MKQTRNPAQLLQGVRNILELIREDPGKRVSIVEIHGLMAELEIELMSHEEMRKVWGVEPGGLSKFETDGVNSRPVRDEVRCTTCGGAGSQTSTDGWDEWSCGECQGIGKVAADRPKPALTTVVMSNRCYSCGDGVYPGERAYRLELEDSGELEWVCRECMGHALDAMGTCEVSR